MRRGLTAICKCENTCHEEFAGSTLRHHARPGGRYERVRRGLYRLRHFPTSPHEHVVAAWIPLRDAGAVVSHESALELYELSDVIPSATDLSPYPAPSAASVRGPVFGCTRWSTHLKRPKPEGSPACR